MFRKSQRFLPNRGRETRTCPHRLRQGTLSNSPMPKRVYLANPPLKTHAHAASTTRSTRVPTAGAHDPSALAASRDRAATSPSAGSSSPPFQCPNAPYPHASSSRKLSQPSPATLRTPCTSRISGGSLSRRNHSHTVLSSLKPPQLHGTATTTTARPPRQPHATNG